MSAIDTQTHPHWCDHRRCNGRSHEGMTSAFYNKAGIVRIEVKLSHDDDHLGQQDHGRTYVELSLTATEWHADAQAELSATEARQLAHMLRQYADLVDRDHLHPIRLTSAEIEEEGK